MQNQFSGDRQIVFILLGTNSRAFWATAVACIFIFSMWCFTEMGHAARGCQSIVFSRAERWQTRGMTKNFTDRGGVRMFWMCSLYRLIKNLFKMVNPPNLCWEKNVLHTRGRTKISEIFQNDSPNIDSGRRKCENFFGTIVLNGSELAKT